MKSAMEIQAERLRETLTEACCDGCGTMSKKVGKKVCCGDKKPAQDKTADTSVGPEFDGGQDVAVRVSEQKEKPTTHPFIKRCVAAITQKDGEVDRDRVSRAFALCTAQMKKSPRAAKAKKKEGVPAGRMDDYESALKQAREKKENDVSLFNRINSRALVEKEGRPTKPEAKLDGKPGYWRRVAGSNIFFTMDGTPQMPIGVERKEKPAAEKDKKGSEKGPDKKEPEPAKKEEPAKEKTPAQKKREDAGKKIGSNDEVNVGKTTLAELEKHAEKWCAEGGTTPEEVMGADWKKKLKGLKEKMDYADDIPRIYMPVIEPPTDKQKEAGEPGDMGKFKDALKKGALDVNPPFAKETKKMAGKHGTVFPWEHGKKGMEPGSDQAKKFVGLGLPKNDKGPKDDDITKATEGQQAAKDLKPLQNEIFLSKVVGNLMRFGAPKPGSSLTQTPIIVSKDGYILDGHHRFAQAMLSDPDLKLNSLDVPVDKPKLLKIARSFGTAIGNKTKGPPVKDRPKGE